MIIVKGEARFGEGEIERLREPLNAWIEEVRQRDGCLSYCYSVDMGDPNVLHISHSWRDEAAIDAHMAELGPLTEVIAGAEMPALLANAYEARFLKTLMGE